MNTLSLFWCCATCLLLSPLVMAEEDKVTVTVSMFSGRRNPKWEIKDTSFIQKLKDGLKDLPETALRPEKPNFPAFQKFSIRGLKENGALLYIDVYKGVITVEGGTKATPQYFKDKNGIEQMLIVAAKEQTFEADINMKEIMDEHEASLKADAENQPLMTRTIVIFAIVGVVVALVIWKYFYIESSVTVRGYF